MKLLITQSSPTSSHFSLLGPNNSPQTLLSNTICVLPFVWDTEFHTHTKLSLTNMHWQKRASVFHNSIGAPCVLPSYCHVTLQSLPVNGLFLRVNSDNSLKHSLQLLTRISICKRLSMKYKLCPDNMRAFFVSFFVSFLPSFQCPRLAFRPDIDRAPSVQSPSISPSLLHSAEENG